MKTNQITLAKNISVGDAAVDGLFGGIVAGIAMAAYLAAVSLVGGGEGFAVLNRFDPNGQSPVAGLLMHLAVAGVYGAAFGIIRWSTRRFALPAWLTGLGFGVALFVFAEAVVMGSRSTPLSGIPVAHFGIAHVIYGLVIGWAVARNSKS